MVQKKHFVETLDLFCSQELYVFEDRYYLLCRITPK